MNESLIHHEAVQPTLDIEIEYPRRIAPSLEETAIYHDTLSSVDLSDDRQFGQVVLSSEHFWLGQAL